MLTNLKAWLWLTTRLDVGPAWQVLSQFESPEQVYFADPAEYGLIPKLSDKHRKQLANKSLQDIDLLLGKCDELGIHILTWQDADYPERLRNIELPPMVLYYRGKLPRFDEEITIAMAGTRKASPYGVKVAGELAFEITRLGGLVVTGIVEGCDRGAVHGALKAGGRLVCVLAGGVDVPYYNSVPNRRLMEDIATSGALVSEYPPGTPHLPDHFLARNRILTGLALGTVCVEAPVRSGTLNVARLALDQGRDVYAVPANIGIAAGAGTNRLLAQGEAICVCSGEDVIEHYWAIYPHQRKEPTPLTQTEQAQRLEDIPSPSKPAVETPPPAPPSPAPAPAKDGLRELSLREHKNEFTDDELAILGSLENGAKVTDTLVIDTAIPARRVSATLTVLTIRGLVKQLPGGRFEACVRLI